MKRIITLLTLLVSIFTYSQVGIGTPTPNKSAELEIKSSKKGILIPRIALESINDATTIEEGNVNSLLIFNTTDEGDLTPGYYYWNENRWVRMIDQSDEALKTPWQIQATDSLATLNTQNIYQQGKVAVGFTKNDSLSDKQFDVKGSIKVVDKTPSEYYNWLESSLDLTSFGFDNSKVSSNVFGVFEEPNFESLFENAAGMFTLLGEDSDGKGALLQFTSIINSEHRSGLTLNSHEGQGAGWGNSTFTLSSTNDVTERGSDISGEETKLNLSVYDGTNSKVELDIDTEKGITFRNLMGGFGGSYTFPSTKGNKNQVLTVSDPVDPITAPNTNQLIWKDLSDLVSQPWKIQATDSIASQNTQNIYQQGKVAVGFTKNDSLSNKQFDVKGDFKALNQAANGFFNKIESNVDVSLLGENPSKTTRSIFGVFDTAEPVNGIYNKTAHISTTLRKEEDENGAVANLDLKSIANNGKHQSFLTLNAGDVNDPLSDPKKAFSMLAAIDYENIEASLIINNPWSTYLSTETDLTRTSVDITTEGIMFATDFDFVDHREGYVFPQNQGNENQVLTSGPIITESNLRQLVWKDLSSIVEQPWKIQNTDSIATQNTQNIYQMGSVAIGANSIPTFTIANDTINPKLHVAGDIFTTGKLWSTNSVYADYVFEKYFNGVSAINNDYKFMSLDYIKEFVKTNKHLPGVTPIKDLEKSENGYSFDITGLTVELLEKTEELFLHTIEQQQQIDELKSQVEENNKRLKILEELFLNSSKKD